MTDLDQLEAWIIHDGSVIIDCSVGFCLLFRCTHEAVIDRAVEGIIDGEDLQALARLRGAHIMNTPDDREFKQDYQFLRFDGTRFWGTSFSHRIESVRYLTKIKWEYDIR